MFLLALACSGPEPVPPAPAPTLDAAPEPPPVELRFVRASLLRLRTEPNPEAPFSPLAINTRVRVLESEGDWVRILAPDGRSGWVARDFLGDAPLSLVEVQNAFAAATTPEDRVTWAERLVALSPGDSGGVNALAKAYAAAGRADDASRVQALLTAAEAERFDRWFPAYRDEVAAIGAELGSVRSAQALVALWSRSRAVTASMGEALLAGYDERDRRFVDGDPAPMLAERMPWATMALYAEGTVPALELASGPWLDAASRTPEAWDDGFFSLVTTAYDNASARGWTAWQRRNSDYGGCSPFGSGEGLHLALLKQADGLKDVEAVAPVVAAIRAGVLADVEKPAADEFPYCLASGAQTPTEGLLSEANQLLAGAALTEAERAMVEQRIANRFGRP